MVMIQDDIDEIKTMMILQDDVQDDIQDGVDEIKIHSSDECRHPETFSSLLLQRGDAQLQACAHQRFHDDHLQLSVPIIFFNYLFNLGLISSPNYSFLLFLKKNFHHFFFREVMHYCKSALINASRILFMMIILFNHPYQLCHFWISFSFRINFKAKLFLSTFF